MPIRFFRAFLIPVALLLCATAEGQQTTVTPNVGFQLPGYNSTNWQVPIYYDFNALDAIFGGTRSIPSLHITGNLQVDGSFAGASSGVTNSQVTTALGFTPLNPANNLSDITNAPAALVNLGGFPAQIPGTWATGTTYAKYALALGSDGNTYISNNGSNLGNNPTTPGTIYWSKFAGGGAVAIGASGTIQAASSTGGLAAATPANLFAALGYTPINPANNGSDFANAATTLAHLGGATAASVATAQATANAALPLSGGALTGPLLVTGGGIVLPSNSITAGGGAEIGSQLTPGTGFLDLHSDGSGTDYDVRLSSTGGTAGVAGSGNATIAAATLTLPATTLPSLIISGLSGAGCLQNTPGSQIFVGACSTGSTTFPVSTGPNQALVYSSSGSTSPAPTSLAASAFTDTTNAANITSGTLPLGRIPPYPYTSLTGAPTIPTAVASLTRASTDYSSFYLALAGGTLTGPLTLQNAALSATSAEIGSQTAVGSAYADLHSDGSTTTDYDVRISSTGGTAGVSGSGNAAILANSLALPNSTTIGGSSLAPSATTDTTNAANISTGTLNSARLPSLFQTNGTANPTQGVLNLVAGSNISLSPSGSQVTISSTGGGGSASFTAGAIQFATSTSATRAATTADLNSIVASGNFQTAYQISKRPAVDISHSDFGSDGSYVTGQNPACTSDNTFAFTNAIAYSLGLASTNKSAPNLVVHAGCYNVSSGLLFSGANAGLNIEGDGSGQAVIHFTGTSGYAIKLIGGNLTSQQYGRIHIKGIRIEGTGHLTGATLLEIQGAQNVTGDDIALMNTGGIGLNLVNTERSKFTDMEFSSDARSINMVSSSNEDYFYNTSIGAPGVDYGGYVYNGNVNAASGVFPTSGATIYPNYRAAVTAIGGQNVHFLGGSCKGTIYQGCFQWFGTNQVTVEHLYVEAFGPGSQNPDFQVGGVSPLAVLTSALTTTSTTAAANGALYEPFYVTDQASISAFAEGWGYDIQPPDYTYPGDTTASVLGGGITKGSREGVVVAGFYGAAANGAGSVQIATRGGGGTTALAWPAGAVLVLPQTVSSDMVSRDMHYNGNLGIASGNTLGCSQNTLNSSWLHSTTVGAPVGTPAMPCAEALIGPVYDGISALTPNRGFSPSGTVVTGQIAEENDYDFSGVDTAHQVGAGLQFVSLNGQVKVNKYDCSAEQPNVTGIGVPASGTPYSVFHSYVAGVCKFGFGFYPADNGSDSYAHVLLNNVVTGATVDTVAKAYVETTEQYQSYGSIIGPNFLGQYRVNDIGGNVEFDMVGLPFTPEEKLLVGGTLNLDLTGTSDTTNKPLYTAGGLFETINGYVPSSTYTFPNGTALAHLAPPSGGQTVTLPAATATGEHHVLLYYGLANSTTTTATSGSLNLNGVNLGSSWTFPGGWVGAIDWMWDGSNWHNRNTVPFLQPATVTAGPGLGTSYTIALSGFPTVHSGVVTFTEGTSPVGTAGSVAFTINYNTGSNGVVPKGCGLKPMNGNAAQAYGDFYSPAPSSTAAVFDIVGTALTAGQQYIYRYDCQVDN